MRQIPDPETLIGDPLQTEKCEKCKNKCSILNGENCAIGQASSQVCRLKGLTTGHSCLSTLTIQRALGNRLRYPLDIDLLNNQRRVLSGKFLEKVDLLQRWSSLSGGSAGGLPLIFTWLAAPCWPLAFLIFSPPL